MKSALKKIKNQVGFTLIELLVVIAIIGVLAGVLVVVIDPLDKIRSANDSGVVSTITQIGRANDSYGTNHNNTYVGGTFAQSVTDLNTAGETKFSTLPAPTGYTFTYLPNPAACTTAASTCTAYVYYTNLLSKRYATTPYYVYANGKGCYNAAAPTLAFNCP